MLLGIKKGLLKIKRGFKMPSYKCQKCGKIWHGWAQPAIFPDCGGKLETVEEEKEEEKQKQRRMLKNL